MSSDSQNERAKMLREVTREMRQSTSFGTSFYQVVATRSGMAVTDIRIVDLLDLIGPSTAGQLAELTGLTTGAITRILDRLEEVDLILRERDANDGRKVIVRLSGGKDDIQKVHSILESIGKAQNEVASRYDEEQIAFLLEFLKHSNALSRKELAQVQQEALSDGEGIFSAPLEDQKSGRLVVSSGISRLSLRAGDKRDRIYQARFEGTLPRVKVKEGVVTIRYPQRLLGLGEKQGAAEVALSTIIPWQIVIQGGAEEVVAELSALDLVRLEITGGFSTVRLNLPAPSSVVPIRLRGGASEITIQRPIGVAAQVNLKGWVSELVFEDQTFNNVGNNIRLQSAGFDPTASRYDIEVTSYATKVTITSD